jgi:3-hydroxyisobutyrate dehydrogenase-like beta-hydroxyacid dehydrogenase
MTSRDQAGAVAFIGAGQMGMPMVRRLLDAGRNVNVFARRAEVRSESVKAGAMATDDLADAVRDAEAVVVCVFSDAQLLELARGYRGFLAAMAEGSLLVVHTTSSPATTRILSDEGVHRGVRVVEAPVSGSANDITAGQITVLLAGEPDDVAHAHEIVAAYGDPILHVGPLGAAQAVKLLNNALLSAHLQLIAEVERIAGEFGVAWEPAVAAIQASSGASRAMGIVQSMGSVHALVDASGHFLRKDIAQALATADEAAIDLGQLGQVNLRGPLAFVDRLPRDAVRELAAIEEIKQLKARYFRFLDMKDWDSFADLFTGDCEHLLPTDDDRRPVPNDQYLRDIRRTLADATTVHHGHTPEITIVGPNEATGTWAMFDDVEIPGDGRGPTHFQGYGYYHETYRRCDDGRWRISSKRNVRLRVDQVSRSVGE